MNSKANNLINDLPNQSVTPPLTMNIPLIMVLVACGGVFFISIVLCLQREMDLVNAFIFSLATFGIATTCWLTVKFYLRRLPYALISSPVVLPLFWSFFYVFLPLGYFYGGETYSPDMQGYYAKTQVWVFLGTITLCWGLSIFTKRLKNNIPSPLSNFGEATLKIFWWTFVGLSFPYWIRAITFGYFRGNVYISEPTPFLWVTDQLSYYSFYAVLVLSVFIISNHVTGLIRKSFFWNLFRVVAGLIFFLLFLTVQYRWLIIVIFLIFVCYCAYRPNKIERAFFYLITTLIILMPLLNTLRSNDFIIRATGLERLVEFTGQLRPAFKSTFSNFASIKRKNEWQRCGDTFEFTAATMAVIPEHQDFFYGQLLLQDLENITPYMLWPEKYTHGQILTPEMLINMRARVIYEDTGMGPIVYLWAEGGPVFLLIGMFLFGLFYGYIYKQCIALINNGLGVLLYSFFPLSLMQLEEDWIMNVLIPLRFWLLIIFVWFLFKIIKSTRVKF